MTPNWDREDDDADEVREDPPKLGKCCICLREDATVRNIIMLAVRAPQEGEGCWGCFQCGLPQAGAVAVLCDECVVEYRAGRRDVALACVGYPSENERIRVQLLTEPFKHDMSKHPEAAEFVDSPEAGD